MLKPKLAVLLAFVAVLLPMAVLAYVSPGKPGGYVNDFAQVLKTETKASLETDLAAFASGGNPEVVVATVPSLGGDSIEEYANQLFREWGIGSQEKNSGVLFIVARDDRKMRIEVGYGLEGALTDIETKYIQEDFVRPYFSKEQYDEGVRMGIGKIKEALKEELTVAATSSKKWGNVAGYG